MRTFSDNVFRTSRWIPFALKLLVLKEYAVVGFWNSDLAAYCRSSLREVRSPLNGYFVGLRVVLPVDAVKRLSSDQSSVAPSIANADAQLDTVYRKLKRLNPQFTGKWWQPTIDNGVVTELIFCTDHVSDISPISELKQLRILKMHGDITYAGALVDLKPLQGMQLNRLEVPLNPISDLSPLRGMPLEHLQLMHCRVGDLTPLKGMPLTSLDLSRMQRDFNLEPLAELPLTELDLSVSHISDLTPLKGLSLVKLQCDETDVADLTPLRGMKLIELHLRYSKVTNLAPIRGMPLQKLKCNFLPSRDTEILRSIPSLKMINEKPVVEFWKEVDKQ